MPTQAVIATWPFGQTAARVALPMLQKGQPALDAAIAGAQAVEDDPRVNSVGYGGLANAIGHDTVTVLTLDQKGNLGGVCTTSGPAHKLPGRVGDSPLIGLGLYVDNMAGAAGATGVGEEIIRINGSFFVVEHMRAGRTPQQACELAVRKVNAVAARRGVHPARVAFLALNVKGELGAASTVQTNFQYAVSVGDKVELRRRQKSQRESSNTASPRLPFTVRVDSARANRKRGQRGGQRQSSTLRCSTTPVSRRGL